MEPDAISGRVCCPSHDRIVGGWVGGGVNLLLVKSSEKPDKKSRNKTLIRGYRLPYYYYY